MSRQSALPGIFIESIEVEKPPFDEPGVVQEFVGEGITKEFDTLKKAEEMTVGRLRDILQELEDIIGPFRDDFKVKYNLQVRTFPEPPGVADVGLSSRLQKRSVRTRARIFARLKNPFEPDVIEVSTPKKNPRLSGEETGEVYEVSVTVTK